MFIPIDLSKTHAKATNKVIEKKVKIAMIALLQPFIGVLKQMFCNGFKEKFSYSSTLMSHLDTSFSSR